MFDPRRYTYSDENGESCGEKAPFFYAHLKKEIEFYLKNGASVKDRDNQGNTALHLTKSEECARTLLEKGAKVYSRNNNDETPLHYALRKHWDAIRADNNWIPILIQYGADVNAKDCRDRRPLHHARSKEIAELLLKHGASVDEIDSEGFTALHLSESAESARVLLENGAQVDFRSYSDETALLSAMQRHSIALSKDKTLIPIEILCKHDANVSNSIEVITHHWAYSMELIRLLLMNGAIFEQKDSKGTVVCYSANFEVGQRDGSGQRQSRQSLRLRSDLTTTDENWIPVRILHGADVSNIFRDNTSLLLVNKNEMIEVLLDTKVLIGRTYEGTTVFDLSEYDNKTGTLPENEVEFEQRDNLGGLDFYDTLRIYSHRTTIYDDLIKTLLEHGADVNAKDCAGTTPIHWAGTRKMIELLLKNGAQIHDKDHYGLTALHLSNHEERTRVLLENGAELHAKDMNGETRLHRAGTREIIEFLLKHGAHINERDNDGNTALHLSNSEEKTRLLLENGAKVNSRNNKGETALHYAVRRHPRSHPILTDDNLIPVLVRYGAHVDALSEDGKTPLDYAIDQHTWKSKTIISLIENGANCRRLFERGRNLLHLAAVKRLDDQRIFEYLVAQDIDINLTDDDGLTPLCYAADRMGKSYDSEEDGRNADRKNEESLLHLGADVNIATGNGLTAFVIECYLGNSYKYPKQLTPITLHMLLLQAADLYISAMNCELLDYIRKLIDRRGAVYNRFLGRNSKLRNQLKRVTSTLREEVEKLKSHKLNDEWSLLKILQTDDHQYITNRPAMDFNIDFSKFPLYGGLIRNKLISDLRKTNLFNICREYFSVLVRASECLGGKPLPSLPYELEVKILSLLGFASHVNLILCGSKVASELVRQAEESNAAVLQLPDVVDRPEVANLLSILELVVKSPSPIVSYQTLFAL